MSRTSIASRNRAAAAVTVLTGALAALAAWAAVGSEGPASALVGAAVALGFCSAAALPLVIAGDGRQGRGGLGFLVLGLTYALRLVLALAVYKAVRRSTGVDSQVVGLTVIACALVWTATHVVLGLSRRHLPALDITPTPGHPVDESARGSR